MVILPHIPLIIFQAEWKKVLFLRSKTVASPAVLVEAVLLAEAVVVAAAVRGKSHFLLFSKSLTTSAAIINPTTGGTKGVEPGVLLLCDTSSAGKGAVGFSFE